MKTINQIAELFMSEIERISRGEVRKEVIVALDQCTNNLVKLARLKMDYAKVQWDGQEPDFPWLEQGAKAAAAEGPSKSFSKELTTTTGISLREQDIEKNIATLKAQLEKETGIKARKILADKIGALQGKLAIVKTQRLNPEK